MRFFILICDAHNDFLLNMPTKEQVEEYVENEIKPAGVGRVLSAVYTTNIPAEFSLGEIGKRFEAARKVSDVFVCTVEDCGFLTRRHLQSFITLAPFCCTLTWNYANALAGGALSEEGFSSWGKYVAKQFEASGIFIDCAHLNRKSFFELADITSRPLFNSHTCLDCLFKHPRNLTDAQIRLILDSNGFIGLTFVDSFYKEKGGVNSGDIATQIDHFVQNFGIKNVGIGTDFFGIESYPKDIKNYFEMANLEQKLMGFGYKKSDIAAIFSGNLLAHL